VTTTAGVKTALLVPELKKLYIAVSPGESKAIAKVLTYTAFSKPAPLHENGTAATARSRFHFSGRHKNPAPGHSQCQARETAHKQADAHQRA
jgi:hypothetical protein